MLKRARYLHLPAKPHNNPYLLHLCLLLSYHNEMLSSLLCKRDKLIYPATRALADCWRKGSNQIFGLNEMEAIMDLSSQLLVLA